jgi:hypothetical protein
MLMDKRHCADPCPDKRIQKKENMIRSEFNASVLLIGAVTTLVVGHFYFFLFD